MAGADGPGLVVLRQSPWLNSVMVARDTWGESAVVPFRLNAEATGIPVASWSSAFAGPAYCGPGMVTVVEFDSFRPSLVQMAPAAVQSVVAGSVMVIAPLPLGSTVIVQV